MFPCEKKRKRAFTVNRSMQAIYYLQKGGFCFFVSGKGWLLFTTCCGREGNSGYTREDMAVPVQHEESESEMKHAHSE